MLFSKAEIVSPARQKLKKSGKKSSPAGAYIFYFFMSFSFILLLVGVVLFFRQQNLQNEKLTIIPTKLEASFSGIYVDLSGAVEKPGLYHLPPDSRVNDLVVAAGGLSAEADRDWFSKSINLAQKLKDGIKIYIRYQDQNLNSKYQNEEPEDGGVAGVYQGKVNINLASQAELETLPGIGPATAQKIIAYRQENDVFNQPEDIKNISGIGEKSYEDLKELITVY